MACKLYCQCGQPISCGETQCALCAPAPGLPNGMTESDYTLEDTAVTTQPLNH